jgi:hypothetical protein
MAKQVDQADEEIGGRLLGDQRNVPRRPAIARKVDGDRVAGQHVIHAAEHGQRVAALG